MRPSTVAIYSSQRRCQEAIDELWSFTGGRTAEELRTDPFMRIVVNLRNNLRLQLQTMNAAYRNHDLGDGNAHNAASGRLKMIVESTRADIDQVLEELDEKLLTGAPRTPRTLAPPGQGTYSEPYTSLSQFHPVRPPTHPDLPHTQRPLYTGGATSRNSQMPYAHTPSGRRPDQFTQATTSKQNGRATVRCTPASSSGTGNQRQLGAKPIFTRPTGRQIFQHTQQAPFDCPTPDVVLKRSTTTSIYKQGERWYKTTTNYPPEIAGDTYTGKRAPSTLTAEPQQVMTRHTLGKSQRKLSGAAVSSMPINP